MSTIREVVVELLRHGPAHNQLLSPLTDYLALVGDHAGETLNVPFEHHQFLHRLKAVRYQGDAEDRKFELEELGRIVSGMLARLPGLIASLADRSVTQDTPLHLRLMLSSAELSLLPFELANMPGGIPGAGKPLALQSQHPVCLTRRVRRITREGSYWTGRPKVLFVAAAPPSVATVPVERHLMALRDALDPWLSCSGDTDELKKHLVFVPNATINALEEACKAHDFTHVHILAHGIELEGAEGPRYGLALHDATDINKTDVVDGERLATALRVYRKQAERGQSQPVMVTIASCDSAQQGTVVGAGASVAHHLHEAGIPMVVASQFPLSVRGSVILTQVLYKRLLWGTDPRVALTDLRRQLFSRLPDCHDWASLVVYDGFPADLDHQQARIGIIQANESIKAALNCADRAMAETHANGSCSEKEKLQAALEKLEDRTRRLEELIALDHLDRDNRTTALGMLASAKKRQAQVQYKLFRTLGDAAESDAEQARTEKCRSRSLELLGEALAHYQAIYHLDLGSHWAITQYLSLYAVLAHSTEKGSPPASRHDTEALMATATLAAELQLESCALQGRIWAWGALAELAILRAVFDITERTEHEPDRAHEFIDRMLSLIGGDYRPIYSTIHQLRRYWGWYREICDEPFRAAIDRFARVREAVDAIELPTTLDF